MAEHSGYLICSILKLFWQKEKQETISDFLLGGAAIERLVFSFEG